MSIQLQLRRDTATDLALTTPALAEPGFDITNKRFLMGDASAVGGIIFPNYLDLHGDKFNYAAAGGSANAITASTAINPSSLAAGMRLRVKIASNNTTSATLQWGSTTATAIKKYNSSGSKVDVAANDLIAGKIVRFDYDGTHWVVSSGISTAGGLTLISATTVSGVSSVDFTSGIDSTYDEYEIHVVDGLVNNSEAMFLRTSSNGGSSFDAGASDYIWNSAATVVTTSTPSNSTGNSAIFLHPQNNYSTGGSRAHNAVIRAFNPAGTTYYKAFQIINTLYTTGGGAISMESAWRTSTSAVNALRLLASNGNISGTFKLYGVAKV